MISLPRLSGFAVLAVVALSSVSVLAKDSDLSGGVRLGTDLILGAKVAATTDTPTGEAFVRFPIAASTAVELTVGYRHYGSLLSKNGI